MTFGFIGLGRMGKPMAARLTAARLPVVLYNRTRAKADALATAGTQVATTPADLARQAEIVFTCLLYPADVERVYFGSDGLLEGSRPGQVFIDASTVGLELTRRTAKTLADRGVIFLDAPVSGGVSAAERGTLTFMVGGDKAGLERARPAFDAMGSRVFHVGSSGNGTAMKLCNQLLVSVGEALAAEAMVFGVKAGLHPRDILDVVSVSSGFSVAFERVVKDFVLQRNFEPAATVNLIIKDLDCIDEAAVALGVRALFAAVARQCFLDAKAQGHGERDLASVILPMEQAARVQVGPA